MSVEESSFTAAADEFLSRVADMIDDALGDDIDAELQGGILTLALEAGGQYVINKHAPNRQIWMSSPVSGASHYDFADGQWLSTRDQSKALPAVLAAELNAKFGVTLAF
ncbi:MAG: protein implicated in iron [Rhodospirillaceae bacterium]|nr:MAG: protein implicated in iron [Rhodospirillaceae bacterium]TNC96273.1 MAG: protein implicated in iron transport [Stygiobacter sp.]